MMGRQDAQQPLYCVVDLDERVPPGHPLRKVRELIDFSFVRAEVAPFYGYNGNESVDPAVILKLLFLLFLDDVPSERELMRQVAYRLDYLWFLGLSLNDPVPDHSVLSKRRRAGIFTDSQFVYDPDTDTYRCPAGQTLWPARHHTKRQATDYTTAKGVCDACPLRQQCTRSKTGRSIKRHDQQDVIDRARTQAASPAGKRDRRRRMHLMERSFADASDNHGLKRSRWRGLWRQRIQDLVIAAVQNVRILWRNGKGPKPASPANSPTGGRVHCRASLGVTRGPGAPQVGYGVPDALRPMRIPSAVHAANDVVTSGAKGDSGNTPSRGDPAGSCCPSWSGSRTVYPSSTTAACACR